MIDYEYYHEQYRHVPRNSVSIEERDLVDYHSTLFSSSHNIWSVPTKRPVTTTYIDGSTLLDLHKSPYNMNGLFPKGKSRRKPFIPCEKKIHSGNISISLIPAEKTMSDTATDRSSLSMSSTLPNIQRKSADNRINSTTVFDDRNSEAKFYGRCATTHADGGWVRRYKSINQSQILTALLSDQAFRDKISLRKRTYHQLPLLSSSSTLSSASSLNKSRRTKG